MLMTGQKGKNTRQIVTHRENDTPSLFNSFRDIMVPHDKRETAYTCSYINLTYKTKQVFPTASHFTQ